MPCTMRLNKFKPYKNPKIISRGDTKKLTITSNVIRELWCRRAGLPDVPDAEFVVICDASKEGLVEQMPGNVLDHGGVSREHTLGIDHLIAKGIKTGFSMDPSPGLLPQFHLCPRDRVSGHRLQRVDARSCLGSRTGHTYMAGSITWLLEMFSLICICVAPFQGPPSLNLDISQKHSTIMRIIEACKPYPSFLWYLKQKPGVHFWLCLWWSIWSLYHMMIL